MCARPRLDDSLLKHPRKPPRRKLRDGERLRDKPTARLLKNFSAIAQEAEALVWANECNTDNKGAKNYLAIKWTRTRPKPKDFMRGELVSVDENGYETRSYSAEFVLTWAYQNALTDKTPRMIYEQRRRYLCQAERFINEVLDLSDLGL